MVDEGRVVLLWGEDEYLLRLNALELLEARGVRATEVEGSEWRGGETSDLATPSLWGEARALLIAQSQLLPDAGAAEVIAYVKSPSPDALCVLTHVTRGKSAPATLAKAVQAGGGTVRPIQLRRADLPTWLVDRSRRRGLSLGGPAAAELVKTLGEDPAMLDQALDQLASAFAGQSVGPEHVRAQFQGMGEQKVWDLCDLAFAGRLPEALVVLRGLLQAREDPLLILGGIAARVRDLIRVRSLPDRMSAADAAKAAGLRFDWQIRRYREQSSRFTIEALTTLLERVVDMDRAVKGGFPGEVVLAGLVAAMAGDPDAALDVPVRVGR
jgi:DNA polymerase III subunit delta